MKTIYATVTHLKQPLLIYAQGVVNYVGKLRGDIHVGYIGKDEKSHFVTSMDKLADINLKIVAALNELRRGPVYPGWLQGENRQKMTELKEMQNLFIRLFLNDECNLSGWELPEKTAKKTSTDSAQVASKQFSDAMSDYYENTR